MRISYDKEVTGYPGRERCFETQIVDGLEDLQNPDHAPIPYAVVETYRVGRIRSPRVLNQRGKAVKVQIQTALKWRQILSGLSDTFTR